MKKSRTICRPHQYLPAEDRRYDVMLSVQPKGWQPPAFFKKLYDWYTEENGFNHVAAFLAERDLSAFEPKSPPPQTTAFHAIVNATRSPEAAKLADVLDSLARPHAITLKMIVEADLKDDQEFTRWLTDRAYRGQIPHRLDDCGYSQIINASRADNYWLVSGQRQTVYGRKDLSDIQRRDAATTLADMGWQAALKRARDTAEVERAKAAYQARQKAKTA